MALARASASLRGVSKAVCPSRRISGTPPTRVETMGTPMSMASIMTVGMPSLREGDDKHIQRPVDRCQVRPEPRQHDASGEAKPVCGGPARIKHGPIA